MEPIRGKVSASGRIVLPSELRKSFGIEDGTEVLFSRTEYGIQITPVHFAIRRAQELCAKFITQSPTPDSESEHEMTESE